MFQNIGSQIIFFLLSLFIVIRYLILGNNENETNEAENKNKEEILKLKKEMEDISNKNTILIKDNKKLKDKMNLLFFEQNFMINYHDDINQKSKLNKISSNLRVNYLLLSFSSQVKNIIAFTRIINLRKIVNCLLNRIIEKNKKYLKKTFAKFQDILKPKDNQRPFYIIYCTEKEVNGVAKKAFDIIIDFLMFIHDYTSSIIHLNNIKNYQDIIPKIENHNGENSPKSESNISENKTNYSYYPNDIIDYAFNYDIEKETKKMIKRIENEEKQIIEKSKNNIDALQIKEDNLKDVNEEKRKDITNLEQKDENIKKNDLNDSTKYNIISNENENNTNNKYDERNSIMKNNEGEEIGKIDFQFNIDNQNQDSKINNFVINNNQNEENKMELSNNNIIFLDDINTNEENENFEKLKIDFENLSKEVDIKIIKQIFANMNYNKDLDINKLIKLYNDNKNEMADIRNTIEMYNDKINNYKFDYAEEFSIEKMISVYKSQFDKNSSIYEKCQNIIDQHYRFNSSYNKIIDSNDINNFNFDDIKIFIKKISGNELIDLLSEDQGRFGQELLFEDVV